MPKTARDKQSETVAGNDRPVLQANGLTKSFSKLLAVNDVSFQLNPGEAFGLLGPNGAGKTTTINMLIGLVRPDRGTVVIGDRGNPARAADRMQIGIAPQKLSLYEELTGRENLRFLARLYRLPASQIAERVDWCLEFAGLAGRASDRVGNYSGGMQRRLNLACALIHEPSLLLLDEPTVGVDPQSRNHLLESIDTLKKDGMTILYTTHYMEEAQRLCDRVAIMDHGRLLDVGPVSELLASHGGQSVVIARLLQVPDDPAGLPGTLRGDELRFEAADPIAVIAGLRDSGLEFSSVEIRQPDLESVFLSLTGRSLRD